MEFGKIVWARIPTTKKLGKLDQRLVEVVSAGKAEFSYRASSCCRAISPVACVKRNKSKCPAPISIFVSPSAGLIVELWVQVAQPQ